ncbi:MAG: alpha/beta hydrolase [Victivallaceae bacterium]|nr:alpha/beta hydrolase [Victivallaceae bacterium]
MLEIALWNNLEIAENELPPSITAYLVEGDTVRPAVLVIPGGGYNCVCEKTEGEPIARAFNQLGFHAFVLRYRVAPHRYPEPQEDGFRAIRLIRGNAEKFHVDPHAIAACGFSAGGHLAASLGVLAGSVDAAAGDRWDKVSCRPDFLILGYAVISFERGGHPNSGENLLGDDFRRLYRQLSLQHRVTKNTPPTFLWHTFRDQIVPYANSLKFAQALAKKDVACELHTYPYGDHGMLLGLHTPDVGQWPVLAKKFILSQLAMQKAVSSGRKASAFVKYTNAKQAAYENAEGLLRAETPSKIALLQ